MKWTCVLALAFACSMAIAGDLALLGGRLVLTVPAAWETQQQKREDATELTVLGIPLPRVPQSAASANVVILSQPNRSGVGLNDLASSELARAKSNDPEFELQELVWESDVWAVSLATSRDGPTQYFLYDHYAATPTAVVSIRVVLPILNDQGDDWLAETMIQVESFLRSVAIDGVPTGKTKIERDGDTLRLRAPKN